MGAEGLVAGVLVIGLLVWGAALLTDAGPSKTEADAKTPGHAAAKATAGAKAHKTEKAEKAHGSKKGKTPRERGGRD